MEFLRSIRLNKDSVTRLYCWLAELGIIPSDYQAGFLSMAYHYTEYRKLLVQLFGDFADDATELYRTDEGKVIKADVDRSLIWHCEISEQLDLDKVDLENSLNYAVRILTSLALMNNMYSYTQGYDRYALISYSLSLRFCKDFKLPTVFAESIAFYLSKEFIDIALKTRFIEDSNCAINYFCKMDKIAKKEFPDLYSKLDKDKHSSFHFALRWQLLLFADEYTSLDSLLLLWDNFILNRRIITDYLTIVSIAHMKQIPVDISDSLIVEKIQKFRSWDVIKVLNDVNTIQESQKKKIGRVIVPLTIAVTLATVIFIATKKK